MAEASVEGTGGRVEGAGGSGGWRWVAGAGLGLRAAVAVGLTLVVSGRAGRFRKAKMLAGLVAAAGLLGGAVAAVASAPEGPSVHPPGKLLSRPTQDCGRYVLSFLGRYYQTGWDAQAVLAKTRREGGLSLLEVRDTARAMGLKAEGVQLASAEQLSDLLRAGGTSVVLGTTTPGSPSVGHFFCVLGANEKGFVVADPPRPVSWAGGTLVEQALLRGKGYAIVVRPGHERP